MRVVCRLPNTTVLRFHVIFAVDAIARASPVENKLPTVAAGTVQEVEKSIPAAIKFVSIGNLRWTA